MGQRYVELETSYSGYNSNNTAILHVSQLQPNPAILTPGPALMFIVVNGVPSVGVQVTVGNGKVGTQDIKDVENLPASNILRTEAGENGNNSSGSGGSNSDASFSNQPLSIFILAAAILPFLVSRW